MLLHVAPSVESYGGNRSLLPGLWRDSLHVTCGLTACTPGSAPGPTLGNEYGKTLPFFSRARTMTRTWQPVHRWIDLVRAICHWRVVMSSEPTAGSLHVHATNCLFQTLNTNDKLETCLIEMCRNDFTRVFMTFINW